jgi:hypothetical protein
MPRMNNVIIRPRPNINTNQAAASAPEQERLQLKYNTPTAKKLAKTVKKIRRSTNSRTGASL